MKLKICPYCGGEAKVWRRFADGLYHAQCGNCLVVTAAETSRKLAAKNWNARIKQ